MLRAHEAGHRCCAACFEVDNGCFVRCVPCSMLPRQALSGRRWRGPRRRRRTRTRSRMGRVRMATRVMLMKLVSVRQGIRSQNGS